MDRQEAYNIGMREDEGEKLTEKEKQEAAGMELSQWMGWGL